MFFFFALAIFGSCFLSSCNQQSKTTTTVTTVTTVTPNEPTNGFYIKTKVIVKGNTVWGISQKVYGTGFKWRDIVAQNPFLNAPGRVYYDQTKKIWIALIYPGEVLKIGNEVITPTYVVKEETKTTTTTSNEKPVFLTTVPWWGWLLLLLTLAGIIALFILLFRNSNNPNNINNSNSSPAVHVDLRGVGIDDATRATLLGRQQDLDDRAVAIAEKGEAKNKLSRFAYIRTDRGLVVASEFFPTPADKSAPAQHEEQSGEGK